MKNLKYLVFIVYFLVSCYSHLVIAQPSCHQFLKKSFKQLSAEEKLNFVESLIRINNQIHSRNYSFWLKNPLSRYYGSAFIEGGYVQGISPLDNVWEQFHKGDYSTIEKLYDSDTFDLLKRFTIPFDLGSISIPRGTNITEIRDSFLSGNSKSNILDAVQSSNSFNYQNGKIIWLNRSTTSSPASFGSHPYEQLKNSETQKKLKDLGFKYLHFLDPEFKIEGKSKSEKLFNSAMGSVFNYIRLLSQSFNFWYHRPAPINRLRPTDSSSFKNYNEFLVQISRQLMSLQETSETPEIIFVSEREFPI